MITSFLETGVVAGITHQWVTVALSGSYASAVVVATPNYDLTHAPVVTRIKNVTANSFDLRVQTADGLNEPILPVSVHFLVAEEGHYTAAVDGITLEAVKVEGAEAPSITDGSGSWQGTSQVYRNTYSTPVVVGQVMSTDDAAAFSVFWARGTDSTSPPTSDSLFVGKHVGEDPTPIRPPEPPRIGSFAMRMRHHAPQEARGQARTFDWPLETPAVLRPTGP